MSAFVSGRLELRMRTNVAAATNDNKFVSAVAALIPTEVLGVHALILAKTTTTDAQGTTTITDPGVLGLSLWLCLALGPALYLAGRTRTQWDAKDTIGLFLPAFAFVAWAALIGTSALTPVVAGKIAPDALWLIAVVLGAILILVKKKIS